MRRDIKTVELDETNRALINMYQGDFPICEEPYAEVATRLGITEDDVINRISTLLEEGVLSRFGPLYNAERLGGGLSLAAIKVPENDYDRIADIVNSFPEVAHNYAREDAYNMWFVLATETPEQIEDMVKKIEEATGLDVMNVPKLEEFSISLRFEV